MVFLNGKILSDDEAAISLFDHGLLYGFGLFATIRAYDGHLFLVDDHLQKLRTGMKEMGIRLPDRMKDYEQAMLETMRANRVKSGKVRITITPGEAGWRQPRTPYKRPNVFVFVRPHRDQQEPARQKTVTILRTRFASPMVPYKSLSRLSFLYAFRELQTTNADEGLFLTDQGEVAEGISSNIFIVRDGVICTPPVGIGIVAGVTRNFVLQLASAYYIPVKEKPISVKELSNADEIFLTNSMAEIVPVHRIDNIYLRKSSTLTDKLIRRYQRYTDYLRSAEDL